MTKINHPLKKGDIIKSNRKFFIIKSVREYTASYGKSWMYKATDLKGNGLYTLNEHMIHKVVRRK